MKKNNHCKALWGVFLVLAILLVIQINVVSAFEFDNVKDYNADTKTITIKNSFAKIIDLDTIAEIKLDTELIEYVSPGSDVKVAEFTLDSKEDYENWYQDMKFYNLNNGNKKIEKDFVFKKKIITQEYECWDYIVTNGSRVKGCNQEEYRWEILNKNNIMNKGKTTIGIFTDVSLGERVEWIPTLYGESINEWAIFEGVLYDDFSGANVDQNRWTNTSYIGAFRQLNLTTQSFEFNSSGLVFNLTYLTPIYSYPVGGNLSFWVGNKMVHYETVSTPSNGNWSFVYTPTTELINVYRSGILESGNVDVSSESTKKLTIMLSSPYSGAAGNHIWQTGGKIFMDAQDGGLGNFQISIEDSYYDWTSAPAISLNQPIDYYNSSSSDVTFNCSSISDVNNIQNISLYINGILNYTKVGGTYNNLSLQQTLGFNDANNYNWSCESFDTLSEGVNSSTIFFNVDSTEPSINIISPTGTINYHAIDNNLSLNWSLTESNPDTCWFEYNNTNTTVTCDANNYSFITVNDKQSLTFYANDTSGNLGSNTTSWDYKLLFINQTYINSTTSGSTNNFISNFKTNGTRLSTVYLNYNNTNSITSLTSSGNNYTATISQLAPGVETTTNISFYWNATMEDGTTYATNENNQSVSSIIVNSTCGTGSYVIYNLSLVDENTQQKINGANLNGSITVDFNLYTSDRNTKLKEYSTQQNNIDNLAICIDDNLSNEEQYSMDLQIQYSATNYSSEFYNLEEEVLSSSTLNQNITLYDLLSTNAQEFKLNVRDSGYVPIKNALVKIERKYIENGTFYITEIPKTDSLGTATASLQVDNVIYNFYVYSNNVLTSSFTNVYAVCQNPTLRECEIDFNEYLSGIDVPDYSISDDFNYTLDYDSTSRTITSQFLIPSGEPLTISLNVIKEDALGTAVCSDSLTSTSGTLTCIVPNNFGNATIKAKLYRENELMGHGSFKLDQTPSDIFGVILIFISVLVMMTLIGISVSDSPVITGIFLLVGLVLLFSMNLVSNTGFYGATATILFFAIALIIVLIKAARRS